MAEKLAYSDPSLQILNFLQGMGGTSNVTTAGGNVNPLEQVLNAQMGGITPEGAKALIGAIFREGATQVPTLMQAYGQSAGARTVGNSPLNLALQDMNVKMADAATKQVSANQQAASQTAGKIAENTRSSTQTAKPRNQSMMALPFILANAGKLKQLAGGMFSSGEGAGTGAMGGNIFAAPPNQSFNIPQSQGFNVPITFDSSVSDVLSSAPGSMDTAGFDGSAFAGDLGFSEIPDLASAPILDELTGVADFGVPTDIADEIFNGFFGFKDGGHVNLKAMRAAKPAGYADGGSVQSGLSPELLQQFGLSLKDAPASRTGGQVRGRSNMGTGNNVQLRMPGTNSLTSPVQSRSVSGGRQRDRGISGDTDVGSSGVGAGIATGETGTGISNAGLGAIAGIVGMATGIPGISTVASLMGLPSPLSSLISALTAATPGDVSSSPASVAAADSIAADVAAETAMDAAISGMMAADAASAASAGAPGEGGGIGGSGASAGDAGNGDGGTGGDGTGDGSGGGTASAANGGEIDGPGTATSDSIMARLSDGEYVMPADSVNFWGVPMLEMMRAISHKPVNQQRKVR